MKPTAILDLMAQDHAKLIKDLTFVEKNIKENLMAVMPSYHTFEWNLQKHIFVEERVIFSNYNPNYIGTMYEKISDIKKQHSSILKKIDSMKKNVKNQDYLCIVDFKRILVKHKNYEETNIYPILDQELNEEEKLFIIERIKEII
jgi:hemerythrin superfamily protein